MNLHTEIKVENGKFKAIITNGKYGLPVIIEDLPSREEAEKQARELVNELEKREYLINT